MNHNANKNISKNNDNFNKNPVKVKLKIPCPMPKQSPRRPTYLVVARAVVGAEGTAGRGERAQQHEHVEPQRGRQKRGKRAPGIPLALVWARAGGHEDPGASFLFLLLLMVLPVGIPVLAWR